MIDDFCLNEVPPVPTNNEKASDKPTCLNVPDCDSVEKLRLISLSYACTATMQPLIINITKNDVQRNPSPRQTTISRRKARGRDPTKKVRQLWVPETIEWRHGYVCIPMLWITNANNAILVVRNLHLFYYPLADHVCLMQAYVVCKKLESWSRKNEDNEGTREQLVFCGDFNSDPGSGGLRLLLDRKVTPEQGDTWTNLNKYTWDSRDHNLAMRAAPMISGVVMRMASFKIEEAYQKMKVFCHCSLIWLNHRQLNFPTSFRAWYPATIRCPNSWTTLLALQKLSTIFFCQIHLSVLAGQSVHLHRCQV